MTGITFDLMPGAIGQVLVDLAELKRLVMQQNQHAAIPSTEQPLNIKQAAELLNLKVPTVYGLVHKEQIPYYKRGKFLYFNRRELLDWVQAGRVKTKAEIEEEALGYTGQKK